MKFRKATKKIVAVASATALASASVFGAANYPSNFVQDGELNAQVVVGSGAASSDMNAAMSIVADLEDRYSEGSSMTTITYREASEGGERVQILNSGEEHLLGENLDDNRDIPFDDGDLSVLEDGEVRMEDSDEEYSQEINFGQTGTFEHSLRDRLEDDMSQKMFFEGNEVIMSYTMNLDSSVDVSGYTNNDIVGEKITIMGNEFTIGNNFGVQGNNFDELKLLGGANEVTLGFGESTTVTVEGNEYDVTLNDASTTSAQLTINGVSKNVDEFESEVFGNTNVVVTDVFSTDRTGYASFIVGGQEVLLQHGDEVQINDEDISDVFDDYEATVYFSTDGDDTIDTDFDGFRIDYSYTDSNGLILREGEMWEDRVFNAVGIQYDGTNNPDYTVTEFSVSGDDLSLSGETVEGESFDREIGYAFMYNGDTEAAIRLIGDTDTVPMIVEDVDFSGIANQLIQDGSSDAWEVQDDNGVTVFTGTAVEIQDLFVNTSVLSATSNLFDGFDADFMQDGAIIFAGDEDNQYLYQVTNYDRDSTAPDSEFSFEDLLSGSEDNEVRVGDVDSELVDVTTFTADGDDDVSTIAATRAGSELGLAFAQEMMVDLRGLTALDLETGTASSISIGYDEGDMDLDDNTDVNDFDIDLDYDTDDEEIELTPVVTGFQNFTGAKYDISDSNDDVQQRVDKYGTIVEFDTDERGYVTISVPDEQVEAMVYLTAGASAGSTMTETVSSDMVDDRVAELEADGFTVVSTSEMSTDDVTVNIDGPLTDMDLTEADVAAGNHIVVGGPAVNEAARIYLGIDEYTIDQAGVAPNEFVHLYYESANSIVVYGYSAADTTAAVEELNAGTADFEEE